MLSIIIVNYNSWDLLANCLRSILPAVAGYPLETLVIDNASADDRTAEMGEKFPWVRFLRNKINTGFAAANNLGIANSSGTYILLLNPDTEAQPGAISEMVRLLEAMPETGIIGPKIYFPGGSLQYSCGRFPTLATEILENFFLKIFPRFPLTGYYLYRNWDHATTRMVDWVTGACLMIRRATIDQIGMLDETYFIYSEEIDWCYRAREMGWSTFYYPRAVVIHHEGGSSRDTTTDTRFQGLVYRQYIRSNRLFFRKFHGAGSEFILRGILLVSHYLRMHNAARHHQIPVLGNGNLKAKAVLFQHVLKDLLTPLDRG